MDYARTVSLDAPYDEAVQRVKETLKQHGFGTLTEIDVRETLRAKLGVETERYVILGVCNPGLAHRALEVDRQVGVLLPCTVVVREQGDGTIVHALDPAIIASVTANPALEPIAARASELIQEAMQDLARAPVP